MVSFSSHDPLKYTFFREQFKLQNLFLSMHTEYMFTPLYRNLFAHCQVNNNNNRAENRWRRQAEREDGGGRRCRHRHRRRHSIWTCPGQPWKNTSLLCRLVDGFAASLVWLCGLCLPIKPRARELRAECDRAHIHNTCVGERLRWESYAN